MTKTIIDLFNDLFGESFNEDFLAKFAKVSSELEKETKKCDEKKKDVDDYYHVVSDEYENGYHTYHKEKEVVNGKVTKDESFANSLPDKKDTCTDKKYVCDNKHKCRKSEDNQIQVELEIDDKVDNVNDRIEAIEKRLDELIAENKILKDTIECQKKELDRKVIENNHIQAKLDKIRHIF